MRQKHVPELAYFCLLDFPFAVPLHLRYNHLTQEATPGCDMSISRKRCSCARAERWGRRRRRRGRRWSSFPRAVVDKIRTHSARTSRGLLPPGTPKVSIVRGPCRVRQSRAQRHYLLRIVEGDRYLKSRTRVQREGSIWGIKTRDRLVTLEMTGLEKALELWPNGTGLLWPCPSRLVKHSLRVETELPVSVFVKGNCRVDNLSHVCAGASWVTRGGAPGQ